MVLHDSFVVYLYAGSTVVSMMLYSPSTIECTVDGGNPNTHNHMIWLIKNNKTIFQTYGCKLSYNIDVNVSGHAVFGVYTCFVESLHSSHSASLLIPERGIYNIAHLFVHSIRTALFKYAQLIF